MKSLRKFTPYAKMSKKKKREQDISRRKTWGTLNPVTRRAKSPKSYDRAKLKRQKYWIGSSNCCLPRYMGSASCCRFHRAG